MCNLRTAMPGAALRVAGQAQIIKVGVDYVRLCNGVTERDIARAVDAGVRSFGELQASTGVAAGCGSCTDYARQLLRAVLCDFLCQSLQEAL